MRSAIQHLYFYTECGSFGNMILQIWYAIIWQLSQQVILQYMTLDWIIISSQ